MSGYNKHPSIHIENSDGKVFRGDEDILRCLREELSGEQWTLIVETYPGVNEDRMHRMLEKLHPDRILSARDILRDAEALKARLDCILTQDRVFGRMYSGELMDFADPEKVKGLRKQVAGSGGKTLVFGFGASLLADQGLCVYADMSRWEIQLRYRVGMSNYLTYNPGEDILRKYKQGYFLEWRIADKLKMAFMDKMQYFIDANRDDDLVMIRRDLFEEALQKAVSGPFRVVPYFDPGVWGGQWMKKVCGLDPETDNYAFGAEFPIRFDLLDTMGGQNLSLQVHPTTDYIRRNFGMAYTQDESYYILDADKDACVYLGLKEGVRVEEMIAELEAAQQDGKPFDAEKYINRIPAKKHDHFLIPAGTIHCSGKGAVVLEISATPYIFTFKLWDWGRLGLDGKPRPINIGRGAEVIAERRTEWVRKNLVNPVCTLAENEHYTEEHTGLHELEFIETRRFTIRDRAEIDCHESVNVLNLVEGTACFVESADGSFDPFEVHYAETFIVPECVGKYRLRAVGGPVKVMQAYVRI